MALANHVVRRGATYIWRRRCPARTGYNTSIQVSLRTREPAEAKHIASALTARSADVFDEMISRR